MSCKRANSGGGNQGFNFCTENSYWIYYRSDGNEEHGDIVPTLETMRRTLFFRVNDEYILRQTFRDIVVRIIEKKHRERDRKSVV